MKGVWRQRHTGTTKQGKTSDVIEEEDTDEEIPYCCCDVYMQELTMILGTSETGVVHECKEKVYSD